MGDIGSASTVEEHLREAAELTAVGRHLAAIDHLTAANRLQRDPEIERRLVEARRLAFPQLRVRKGRPVWPAEFPDPFPDVHDLPVIGASELTGDVLGGAITRHGALLVRNMVDTDAAGRLRDHIEASFVARSRADAGDPSDGAPEYVPFSQGQNKAKSFGGDKFVRVVDSPSALFDLAELFARCGITGAVADYLGERPAMIANKWVLRRSPSGVSGRDFHQDGAFLGDGIRTVDCWIALSTCGPGTGRPGIDLVPGRLDRILPSDPDATFDWSVSPAGIEAELGEVPLCSPVFEPGDALFFDQLLPHRTAHGPELTTRYAIESWFVAPSSYPAKHVPVVL